MAIRRDLRDGGVGLCARATRGVRSVGWEPPDRPSCSQNAHDEAVLVRCGAVKDSLAAPLRAKWGKSEGPRLGEERVSARSGGRVRMGRAVEPTPPSRIEASTMPVK